MDTDTNKTFMILLGISQALAIAMVVLSVVWTNNTLEGYAWDGSAKEFNLHPLCMVCGFILLYGEAALAFRVFSQHDKAFVKIIHGSFHLIAFIAMVVGLQAVFDFHNANGISNMYSLHSWCGITTVVLFSIQYVFGFVTFLFPKLRLTLRQCYMPIHRYFGLGILFLTAISSISGINEKLFFVYPKSGYSQFPRGAVLGNCLGLAIVAFIVVVGFIVHNPAWKRQDIEDETEPLAAHFKPVTSHTDTTDEE